MGAWLLESYCNCLIVNGLLHIEYDVLLQSDWQPDLTSVSTSEQANNDDDYTANGANTEVKKYHIHVGLLALSMHNIMHPCEFMQCNVCNY